MLILAQAVLVVGSISLIHAGSKLFRQALEAGLPVWMLAVFLPVAVLLGYIKATKVMRKRMRGNVDRLRAKSGKSWPWQIYPVQLLGFIFLMNAFMFVMKRVLAGGAYGLAGLGSIDVTVAVALFVVSGEYRRR